LKRRFQGLEETIRPACSEVPDGLFLVRVDGAKYRWNAQKPFYWLRLAVLEPREFVGRTISGRLYCTPKALWKLGWFLRDFLYDVELLGRAEVDEKALFGLRGIVKISRTMVSGRSLLNLEGFCSRQPMGRVLHTALAAGVSFGADEMTYSYTQISRYLRCPRHYRRRCLDGWREKDTRAAMVFGRAFEKALSAYFLQKDAAAVLFRQWAAYQNNSLEYANSDSWERMLHQGIQLLERFAQEDRVRIRQPRRNLQVNFTRPSCGQERFVELGRYLCEVRVGQYWRVENLKSFDEFHYS
jgi:hypothetical protein